MDKNVKIKHDTKIYYSVMYTESKFKNNLYYRNVIIWAKFMYLFNGIHY